MLSRSIKEPGIQKIAVLRANAIGDFIFALPALEALRSAYPAAEIVLLGQEWHARFLAGRPAPVDRVVVVPPSRGVNDSAYTPGEENPAELEQFFEKMARERFDLAIQLHGGGRYSNPFVRRLAARLTVGMRTPDAEPLDRWIPYIYFQNEILRYLEVVSLIGASPTALEPRIAVTEADLAESYEVISKEHPQPLVALHPGAGSPRRRWPPEQFAAAGDAMAMAGAHVVVTGHRPEEQPITEQVVSTMQAEAVNLWARLSLGGLAGLLSRCAVVISNDSGPLHLAAAAGAATVGIYWCGNLINAGPVTRTHHRPAISWRLNCPRCNLNTIETTCEHEDSFVADVPSAEVIASALDLLGASNGLAQRLGI